jgi:phosphoribosylformylglycinamidine (FGAM) synthase PurS component
MPKNKNNKMGKIVGPSKGKNMMPKKKKKNKKTKKSMVQTQANKLRQKKLLELALKQTIDEEEQEAAEDEIDDQLLRNTAVNSFSHKTGKPPTENEINEKMGELRRREKDARAQVGPLLISFSHPTDVSSSSSHLSSPLTSTHFISSHLCITSSAFVFSSPYPTIFQKQLRFTRALQSIMEKYEDTEL